MSAQRFYYLDQQGEQQGPVRADQLRDLCASGRVTPDRFIWTDGWSDWQPASRLPELFSTQQPDPVATAVAEPPTGGVIDPALQPEADARSSTAPQRVNAFGVPIDDTPEADSTRHLAPPTEPGPMGVAGTHAGFVAPRTPWGGPPRHTPDYRPGSFMSLLVWWLGFAIIGSAAYAAGFAMIFMDGFSAANNTMLSPEQQAAQFEQAMGRGLLLALAGVPFLLLAALTWYRLFFRCWRQIQDGFAQTTPGKAVGFLFIPFFNLYRHFVAFHGLARDMKAYAARHGVPNVGVSPGVGLTLAIANVGAFVGGFLGPFALLVPVVLGITFLVFTWQITSGARAIAAHQQGAAFA